MALTRRSPHCTTISDSFVYLCDNKTTRQPPRGMGKCRIYTYIGQRRPTPTKKKKTSASCAFICVRFLLLSATLHRHWMFCCFVYFEIHVTEIFLCIVLIFICMMCVCGVFVRSCNVCDKKLMFPDGMKRRRQRVYCEKTECAHQILSARTFCVRTAHSTQSTPQSPQTLFRIQIVNENKTSKLYLKKTNFQAIAIRRDRRRIGGWTDILYEPAKIFYSLEQRKRQTKNKKNKTNRQYLIMYNEDWEHARLHGLRIERNHRISAAAIARSNCVLCIFATARERARQCNGAKHRRPRQQQQPQK